MKTNTDNIEMIRDDYSFDVNAGIDPGETNKNPQIQIDNEFEESNIYESKNIEIENLNVKLQNSSRGNVGEPKLRGDDSEPESRKDPDLYPRKLKNKLSDIYTFMDKLSNFDLEIYLNFKRETCLFREHFMKLDTKNKEKKDEEIKDTFNEDAILRRVLIKDDEKEEMEKREKKHIQELKNKRKNQKEMDPENIRILFLMQGVLLDIFIKTIKISHVTRSSFIGSLLRITENINKHFLSEGCFFSLVFTTSRDEHFGYWFDSNEASFKVAEYKDNAMLDVINDESIEFGRQYVVKDIFQCSNAEESESAVKCYEALSNIAKTIENSQFSKVKPDQTIWLTHFSKVRNLKYTSRSGDENIKSITFLSALQMYTLRNNLYMSSGTKKASDGLTDKQMINQMKMNKTLSVNLSKHRIDMNPDQMLKEIHENTNPAVKSYDEIYKQVAIFLNFFSNYSDFIQMLTERTSHESVNLKLFEKINESLLGNSNK